MSSKPKLGVDWRRIVEASSSPRCCFCRKSKRRDSVSFMFANRDKRRSSIGCATENDSLDD